MSNDEAMANEYDHAYKEMNVNRFRKFRELRARQLEREVMMAAQASFCVPASSRRSSYKLQFNNSSHPRSSIGTFSNGSGHANGGELERDASSSTLAVSPHSDPGPLTPPSPILLSKCISSLDTPELIGMVGPAFRAGAAPPPLSLPDSATTELSALDGAQMIDDRAPYPINLTEGVLHDADLQTPTTSDAMAASSINDEYRNTMKPSRSMLDASALLSSFSAGEHLNKRKRLLEAIDVHLESL